MMLLSLWPMLQRYAPDLASPFLSLDNRSRRPGDNSPLPTAASLEEASRARYEATIRNNLNSDQPSEAVIYAAIGRGDFNKARKMISKLSDESRRKQFDDMVNAEEALSLAAQGRIYEAETLAGRLTSAASVTRVYPALIKKCAANRDQQCVTRLVYQALKQVKSSDTSPTPPPEGIPASVVANDQRLDPRLSFIAKLAIEILPVSDDPAFNVLDEFVSLANSNPAETEQARISFDVGVFKKLASKNEARAQQTACSLKNPVQRVLALAAIYQWKAKRLTETQPTTVRASQDD